ncbi:MAG TPA: ATP-binding protein [Nocardioidaceae bacterium]
MCDLTPDNLVTLSESELAPFEARSYVRQHACPEHATIALDALSLIASELVTNAVRHGQPPIVLRLSCLTSEVRLSVTDTGTRLPRPRLPHAQGTRGGLGLGLVIVARVAQEWGTIPLPLGKEVWCRIPTGMLPVRRALEGPMPLDLP